MSHQLYDTSSAPLLQGSDPAAADWERLVQTRLPADLESQARELGAFQRARSMPSAAFLLRGLLGYVLSVSSLQELSLWSRLVGICVTTISKQAWQQRLRRAEPWLLWLFNTLLAAPPTTWDVPAGPPQRILLVDGSEVSCQDPHGLLWRLHCAYDLVAGQLAWVRLSSQHVGESLCLVPVRLGDILVSDALYSRARQLVTVARAGGFTLTRFSPHHLPLYLAQALSRRPEFAFDVDGWLRSLAIGVHEHGVCVFFEQSRLPVRLIALVLPPEQAEALRDTKAREARAKGRKLSARSHFLAGYVLLVITSSAQRWPRPIPAARAGRKLRWTQPERLTHPGVRR
jgi:hypothetical protein